MDALREYCSKRGIEIAGEYIDKISGKTKKRPQLDELMKAARRRAVDCVVVLSYDRYSRSLSHLVNPLEEFDALGIDFISLKEGTDTSTPQGKLLFGIMASIAEFDRSMIVERVKSGMAAAKKRGKHLGIYR